MGQAVPATTGQRVVGDLNLPVDEIGLAAALAGDADAFRELTDNTGEAVAASWQSIRPPDQRAGFRSLRAGTRGRPWSGLPVPYREWYLHSVAPTDAAAAQAWCSAGKVADARRAAPQAPPRACTRRSWPGPR